MIRVEKTRIIKCQAQDLWGKLIAFEDFSDLVKTIESVKISKNPDGTCTSDWVALLDDCRIEWTESDVFNEEIYTIDFRQTVGDFREMWGRWKLTPLRSDETQIELVIEFDIGIESLAPLLNPLVESAIVEHSELIIDSFEPRPLSHSMSGRSL